MKLYFRKILLALAALCVGGVVQAQSGGYYGGSRYDNGVRVVSCSSQNQRTVYCSIDTRNGVSLYRQLSSGACIEGSTWGWDGRGVWVTGGCRAEFVVAGGSGYGSGYGNDYYNNTYNNGYYDNNGYDRYGYGSGYGSNSGRTFRCESNNSRTTYCDVDTRYGVRLVRRLSSSYCTEGRSWGSTRNGVWVSNGCRAEFRVGGYSDYGNGSRYGYDNSYSSRYGNDYGSGYNQRLTCESRDGRYNFCRTGGYIRQAQVYRQLSSSSCQYNYNWGYRSDGVWVDNGCRAEFVVN